jgi:putative addiction module CopG family antidote
MIELTPQQQQFVDAQVSAGAFNQPAEVVGAALELLQLRQSEYDRLQTAIEHIERGEFEPLDMEDVKRRGHSRRAAS